MIEGLMTTLLLMSSLGVNREKVDKAERKLHTARQQETTELLSYGREVMMDCLMVL